LTFGDIARGTWPKQFGRRKGVVFSYLMNNYTPEGYLAGQGGEFTFRYLLSSGPNLEPERLSKLGWEAMTPLEVNEIRPNDKPVFVPRPLNEHQAGFLQMDQPNVLLVTWKLAEDRQGSILRFIETSGKAATVAASTPLLNIDQAWLCDAVEDNQHRLSAAGHQFTFEVKPFSIVTVRLVASPTHSPVER
jgi:alpha-mannosidase